jgi:ArsR family metal-binding transcriptional regulator
VSNVEDHEGAEKELKGLIALANRTWDRREEIHPDLETHRRPTPLAVYKLLPGTNCKACGEPSCFNFALKLAASQRTVEDCPPLVLAEHAEKLAGLRAIVIDAPSLGKS